MSLINKEKVLNGVGKAVDVTNKAADKASSFVKEKEIDKKAMKAAKTAEKGIKIAGNKIGVETKKVVSYFFRYFFYRQHSTRYHCRCQRY